MSPSTSLVIGVISDVVALGSLISAIRSARKAERALEEIKQYGRRR